MRLAVEFDQGLRIDIVLFDNPTVGKWFRHFKKLSDSGTQKNSYQLTHGLTLKTDNPQTSKYYWNMLLTGVDELRSLNYQIPFAVPDTFDLSQTTLNQWHRFFTDNETWYHKLFIDPDYANPYDSNFKLPEFITHQNWLDTIDKINFAVHKLEQHAIETENKTFVNSIESKRLLLRAIRKSPTTIDTWLEFDKTDQQINYTYFDHEKPLVILDESILGKSVIRSFIDDDDLNADDCTGRLGSFGGIEIDLNNYRKEIFQSSQFANWLTRHNRTLENVPAEFPIGYVENFDSVLTWIDTAEYKKLVFIE